jgi:hypothetical protein
MLKKRDESSQSTRRRLNGIHVEREEKRKKQIFKKKEKKDWNEATNAEALLRY